ncbi:hypothetical protein DFP73DRAFT_562042 [Morchella snyderi]|nr:hypothetical protein DFP73DRAFT_562042 [Morchella snyderi]
MHLYLCVLGAFALQLWNTLKDNHKFSLFSPLLNNISINALAVSRSKGFYPVWRGRASPSYNTSSPPPDLLAKARACGAAQRTGPYR